MADDIPQFSADDLHWVSTVLFQSLIVQLIESGTLTVEDAQRVFDIALQRTKKEREQSPGAERFVQHVHDNMKWEEFYKLSASKRKDQ